MSDNEKHVMPPFAAPASQHSTWVSVKDRMPESGKRVLVSRFAGRVNGPEHPGYPGIPWVEVSHVYEGIGFMCDLTSTGWATHWMPLPEPPQEILEQPQV